MAGRIPQDFIDDLVARADIAEVIGRRVQLKKAGREYKACCPFHNEKTPSFTVSPAKGFYHCFGCGAHGTAIGFLMDHDHLSFVDAVETLASMLGVEVPRDDSDRPARRYDELFELNENVARRWQRALPDHDAAVNYLKRRGIDGATAKRFGIGYSSDGWSDVLDRYGKSPEAIERLLVTGLVIRKDNGRHYDRFRDRLMFPIRDSRGRTIGFGGRTLGDGEPKYLNSPETVLFHKGRELYGLFEARQALRNIERLVVVEGYMDVVALARHGIDFAVATLGTATTPDHLNRLFRLADNVDFCFDGDRAGRKAAWRALETALPLIREGRQVRFVFLPDGHDPDSFVNEHGANAFVDALDTGVRLADYLINELCAEVDLDSVEGRARLAELSRPLIGRMPAGVYRELVVDSLASRVGLSAAKLERMLDSGNDQKQQGGRRPLAQIRRVGKEGGPSVIRRAITQGAGLPDLCGGQRPPARLTSSIRNRSKTSST
jgi:DNA primase